MTSAGRDDPDVDRLLGAAAVAGGRFRLTVLARVLDEPDPRRFLAAVDRAVRAGVLVTAPEAGEGWFAEDAARRATERELALADRAELHRRIAAALQREPGADHGDIARHLSAAVAATVEPVGRARLQIRLAVQAVRDGDLETARP